MLKRILHYGGHASRLALGFIFLAAGLLKALDVAEFAHQMAEYGLIGPGLSAIAAPLLIALETTLGAALVLGFKPRPAAAGIGLLLVFFIVLEGYGIATGRTESCGCFGAYVQRTPQQVIWEDVGFLALAALSIVGLGAWEIGSRRLAGGIVVAVALLSLGFAIASPRLPIDTLVTELRVGRPVADLKIDHYLPEGGEPALVALLDVTDPVSKEAAGALNILHATTGSMAVVGLTPSTEQEEAAFMWEAYPAFDMHAVDRPTLKRLYRQLPLYFTVRAGRVERIFRDPRPPGADLLLSEAP
jgi:uncharacterized membrane protein YphA (DoxX/SURF4 family)